MLGFVGRVAPCLGRVLMAIVDECLAGRLGIRGHIPVFKTVATILMHAEVITAW